MKRLNEKALNIMYDILDKVRKDFPETKFMWKYNFCLGNYCLIYNEVPNEISKSTFERKLEEEYITPETANEFLDIVEVWLFAALDEHNWVDYEDDIEEVEIVVNKYRHNKIVK